MGGDEARRAGGLGTALFDLTKPTQDRSNDPVLAELTRLGIGVTRREQFKPNEELAEFLRNETREDLERRQRREGAELRDMLERLLPVLAGLPDEVKKREIGSKISGLRRLQTDLLKFELSQ